MIYSKDLKLKLLRGPNVELEGRIMTLAQQWPYLYLIETTLCFASYFAKGIVNYGQIISGCLYVR